MELINLALKRHNLPGTEQTIAIFDYCGIETLKENTLPNATLRFDNRESHTLTINNDKGFSEALQLLFVELNKDLYQPTDANDPKFLELQDLEPVELRRYDYATIGENKFTTFSEELVESFIEHKSATLHTNPITADWAFIFVKVFIPHN